MAETNEITIQEIRDWQKHPVTMLLTREIIQAAVDAGENVYNSVRAKEIDLAHQYLGLRDAYKVVLGLADEEIERLKEER